MTPCRVACPILGGRIRRAIAVARASERLHQASLCVLCERCGNTAGEGLREILGGLPGFTQGVQIQTPERELRESYSPIVRVLLEQALQDGGGLRWSSGALSEVCALQ